MIEKIVTITDKSFAQLNEYYKKFRLPNYQREYSWKQTHWKDFWQTILDLIEENLDKKVDQEKVEFIGNIILKDTEDKETGEIIDGQQRLITISILLSVIYKQLSDSEKEERKKIEDFLFYDWNEEKLRFSLDDEKDNKEFEKTVFFNLKGIENKKKASLINKAEIWFNQKILESDYPPNKISEYIRDKLYFALVVFSKDTEPLNVFMSLNSTGLNLNAANLAKTLLIKNINPEDTKQISNEWKEIVKKITASDNTKINTSMPKFLVHFWWARFGKGSEPTQDKIKKGAKISKANLYRILKRKLEEFDQKEEKESKKLKTKLWNDLKEYAEVYEKITYPQTFEDWWRKEYSPEMLHIVHDIKILNFEQMFPLVLAIHFSKKEKESKKLLTNELRKFLLYMFRTITLRGEYPRNIFDKITCQLIEKVREGQTLFEKNEDYKEATSAITKEFSRDKNELYDLLISSSKTKNNNVRKFILKFYYFEKYLVVKNMSREISQSFLSEINVYEAEHLISRVPREKAKEIYQKFSQVKEEIGNITLVPKEYNGKLNNRSWEGWEGKKWWYKKLGNKCLMNVCELDNENLINKEETLEPKDIEDRKVRIIEELKNYKFLEEWKNC